MATAIPGEPPIPQWNDSGFDDAEKVLRWRYHEFRLMQFDRTDARLLADSEADLHLMADLLGASCPPEIAVDILT